MYVRIETNDVANAIKHIEKEFGSEIKCEITSGEFAFITPSDTIANINKKLSAIAGTVLSKLMVL